MDINSNNVPTNGQPAYQPQSQQSPTSVGNWFLTLLLMCIPIVGFVMLFVWAFGGGTELSKKNWAKAQLIWILIAIILSIVFGTAIVALIAGAASGLF